MWYIWKYWLLIGGLVEARLDSELISSYFHYRHISYGSVYGCFDRQQELSLAKDVMLNNLSVSIFDIKDPSFNINKTDVFRKNNGRLGIVLDGDCPTAHDFLRQSSICEVFTDVHFWLVFLSTDTIHDLFRDIVMTISTDLKVATLNEVEGDNDTYILYDVYNQAGAHGGSIKVSYFHTFVPSKPLIKWRQKMHLYWERRNMTGVTFRAMVVLPNDFPGKLLDYLVNEEHREVNTFNRFQAVLIYHVRDYYNFSINASWTKSWGYKLQNNTFDGLVRALEEKVVDFGMSPLFVKYERWPVIDYGRRSWLLRSAFIFRIPKHAASFEVFLHPLDGPVWYVTLAAMILIIFLLKMALNAEYGILHRTLTQFEATWSFLGLFTIGAICQQGAEQTPTTFCGRILVIYIFIFAVLLYQFYSASIVSILLMTPARIIKDLRDLAYSQLKLGVEDVLYNKDYIIKLKNDPVVSMLEKKAMKTGNISFYVKPEIGLNLVAKGGYAFHVEVTTAYPIIESTFNEDELCSLDEVQLFSTQQMHQPLQKHSPFRDMIDFVLHRIDETGLMKRQLKHWHARKPECIRSQPPTSAVSLEEFYPALSVLVMGFVISFTIMLVEMIIMLRITKQEEERQKKLLHNRLRPGKIQKPYIN